MAASRKPTGPPAAFLRAVEGVRSARLRPEVRLEEARPPQRLAPYAAAVSADVVSAGTELGHGRLVLLYDPAGHEAWQGTFRLVTFVRAELEPELVLDPLLPRVAWSWLTDALDAHRVAYTAPGGTVTRVASESFGALSDRPVSGEVEIRASWTPLDDMREHVEAWADLLCTASGLPPVPPGVVPIPSRRPNGGD